MKINKFSYFFQLFIKKTSSNRIRMLFESGKDSQVFKQLPLKKYIVEYSGSILNTATIWLRFPSFRFYNLFFSPPSILPFSIFSAMA